MKAVLATILIAAAFALSTIPASAEEWGEFTREELFATHFPEVPHADAVVLLDEGVLRIDEALRMKLYRHRRTKIFTPAAVSRGEMRIPIAPGDRVEDLRAQTLVPPNRAVKVEGRMIREIDGPDGRELVVTFPEVAPGVILEIQYEYRSDDLTVVDPWEFQSRDFTRTNRLDLLLPDGLSYQTFFVGLPEGDPASERKRVNDPDKPSRQLNRIRWELAGLAPVADVPFLGCVEDARAAVIVQFESYLTDRESRGFVRPWSELASDAALEDATRLAALAGRRSSAAAAAVGATPEEKARSLHAWVRDADGLAAGDRNLLLAAALRDAGLDASVLRVRTRDRGEFRTGWHALRALNHSIVSVKLAAEPVLLDASDPHLPFGRLGPEARVSAALRVAETGGGIVTLDPIPPSSIRGVKTTATIDETGALAAKSVFKLTGDPALCARRAIAENGERAWAESVLARPGDGRRLESVEVKGADTPDEPLAVRFVWAAPEWAIPNGESAKSPAPFLLAQTENPFTPKTRDHPIDFGWVETTQEEVRVTYPEGATVTRVPKAASGRAGQLAFSTTWRKNGAELRAVRKVRIGEATVSESEYGDVRGFWSELVAADGAPVAANIPPVRMAGTR